MDSTTVSPQAFQKVVQASQLVGIHLKSCKSTCHVFPTLVEPNNTQLEINTGTRWNRSEQKDVLFCYVEVQTKGTASKTSPAMKEGDVLFEAQATIVVVYQMADKELDEKAIELFASQNALFNSYPFLREAISNLTVKMGIPPVLLPLLKVGARAELSKPAEPKQAQQA